MIFQPRTRRDFLQLLGVGLAPLLAITPLMVTRKEELESPLEFDRDMLDWLKVHPAEMMLLGNSMVYCRLNTHYLPRLIEPRRVETLAEGGTRSLQWLLWLKNVVAAAPLPPKVVFIFYRDYDFHQANSRIEGTFLEAIRKTMREGDEPLLRLARGHSLAWAPVARFEDAFEPTPLNAHCLRKVDDFALDCAGAATGRRDREIQAHVKEVFALVNLRRDVKDAGALDNDGPDMEQIHFTADPQKNYLSRFDDVAKARRIKLVFYRVRRQPGADNLVPQPKELRQYTAEFKAWAESLGHILLDETDDERITLAKFRDGDHLLHECWDEYTQMFVERIQPLLPTAFTPEEIAAVQGAVRSAAPE